MLTEVPCVVVIRDGVINQHILCSKRNVEATFRQKCSEVFSGQWDKLPEKDKKDHIEDGYYESEIGSVCLSFAVSHEEDDDITYSLEDDRLEVVFPKNALIITFKEGNGKPSMTVNGREPLSVRPHSSNYIEVGFI